MKRPARTALIWTPNSPNARVGSDGNGERGFAVLPSVDRRFETGFRDDLWISLPTDDDPSAQLQLFDPAGVGYLDEEFPGCYFLG